jgi:hypothetical protein
VAAAAESVQVDLVLDLLVVQVAVVLAVLLLLGSVRAVMEL